LKASKDGKRWFVDVVVDHTNEVRCSRRATVIADGRFSITVGALRVWLWRARSLGALKRRLHFSADLALPLTAVAPSRPVWRGELGELGNKVLWLLVPAHPAILVGYQPLNPFACSIVEHRSTCNLVEQNTPFSSEDFCADRSSSRLF
jgi:hypothetical protein